VAQAKAIDQKGGALSTNLDYRYQRLYGAGSLRDNFEPHNQWLDLWDSLLLSDAMKLINTPDAHLLHVHQKRCLAYVGLSRNVLARSPNHWTASQRESPIFGLFKAIVANLYGSKYDVVNHTYQILKTTQLTDIGLDEILISVLTSSYPWDGGLNFRHAGANNGNSATSGSPAHIENLNTNAKRVNRSGFLHANFKDAAEKVKALPKRLEYHQKVKATRNKLEKELDGAIAEIQRLEERVEESLRSVNYKPLVKASECVDANARRHDLQQRYEELGEDIAKLTALAQCASITEMPELETKFTELEARQQQLKAEMQMEDNWD
jgi:hypothetical protein